MVASIKPAGFYSRWRFARSYMRSGQSRSCWPSSPSSEQVQTHFSQESIGPWIFMTPHLSYQRLHFPHASFPDLSKLYEAGGSPSSQRCPQFSHVSSWGSGPATAAAKSHNQGRWLTHACVEGVLQRLHMTR